MSATGLYFDTATKVGSRLWPVVTFCTFDLIPASCSWTSADLAVEVDAREEDILGRSLVSRIDLKDADGMGFDSESRRLASTPPGGTPSHRMLHFLYWCPFLGNASHLLFPELYIRHVLSSSCSSPQALSLCGQEWFSHYLPPLESKRSNLLFCLPPYTPFSRLCTSGRPHVTQPTRS